MSRLGDRLRRHAQHAAQAPAVHAGDRWWSFGELVEAAERLALGAGPGDVVAIAIDRGIEAVLAICAAALAGAIPTMIDPRDRELAVRTLVGLRPAVVVVAPGDDELPGARMIELGTQGAVAAAPPAQPMPWSPLPRADTIAHIIFTSGSTASGKGVVWSELRAGFDWMINRPRRKRTRPAGIVVPLCTALGYHELVNALVHRGSVALLDAPFPAALAQARELRVARLKLTPTHVELLLATAEELPELRAVAIASAPISPDRLRALAARLPGAKISRSYGLTESGAAAMVWLHRKPGKLHTVGRAIGFRRVTVRDDRGRMLPPGLSGEVVIELPVWDACDGYLDAAPELARRFDNGVLWTGDKGSIDPHGFLVLGPRSAEILKVGGRSVGAPRIEESLATLDEIADVAVVGVPDRLLGEVPCAVFVPAAGREARRLTDPSGGGLDDLELRPDERPRWFLARRGLPRSPSGKLRRGQLAQEAAEWTRRFAGVVVPEHRTYPAYDLERGVAIVDGCPPAWLGDHAPLDAGARIITLVLRTPMHRSIGTFPGPSGPAEPDHSPLRALLARPLPIALAVVQAGTATVAGSVRFLVGPVAVGLPYGRVADDLLDVFAGELIVLAGALPGPRAQIACAFSTAPRRAFATPPWAPIAGHTGWAIRGGAEPTASSDSAALAEVAALAPQLARWAQHCALVHSHLHSAGND